MEYLLLFHYNNSCTNAPQCYVIHKLPVLSVMWSPRQSPHNLILRSTFSRCYDLRPTTLATTNVANQIHPPTTPALCTAALPDSHRSAAPLTHPGLHCTNIPTLSTIASCFWTTLQMEPENPSETFVPTYRLQLSLLQQYEPLITCNIGKADSWDIFCILSFVWRN
jgi:hypothetical protein